MEQRIAKIKQAAEERSQLQLQCLNSVDLSKLKKPADIAHARYTYENCIENNKMNYPLVAEKEARVFK